MTMDPFYLTREEKEEWRKMAKQKATSTAMTKWDEKLAALAKQSKEALSDVGSGANFISFRGGIMSYQGGVIPENKMKCVVIDFVRENQFYEGAFDPDNFATPTCYAFGKEPKTMAPNPEDVETPVNDDCHTCGNYQWGSADTGKGKACKQVVRLALITEGDLENILDAEVAYAKVPVTSVGAWAGIARQYEEVYHKPPFCFITEMSLKPNPNPKALPGWMVDFKMIQQIEDEEIYEVLYQKHEVVSKGIAFPYPKLSEAEEAPAPATKRSVRAPAPVQHKSVRGNGKVNGVAKAEAAPKRPIRLKAASATNEAPEAAAPVKLGLKRPVKIPKF